MQGMMAMIDPKLSLICTGSPRAKGGLLVTILRVPPYCWVPEAAGGAVVVLGATAEVVVGAAGAED